MLTRNLKRVPLTWYRFDDGQVRVVCSQGHASMLRHRVWPDGTLDAAGNSPSLHCGHCNETLPLKLDGWIHETR